MERTPTRQTDDFEDLSTSASRFKALGDPTRLRVILLLWRHEIENARGKESGGEITVGDIAELLTGDRNISSTLSHHLKELRQAGLITLERSGKHKFCHLNHATLKSLAELLQWEMMSVNNNE